MTRDDVLAIPIRDRSSAGQALARLLGAYRQRPDVIVLALPRGGVPVAYEIASALQVRLDLMLVRKLGVPGHTELAMGAIASGGVRVLNHDVLASLHIDGATVDAVAAQERLELQRRDRAYRGERPLPVLDGQQVILVDDGLATGATMQAAIKAVRQQSPARIVVAIPVAPADSLELLRRQVDEVICPFTPAMFIAIGRWYVDFAQTSDQQVQALLRQAWQREQEEQA